MSTWHEIIGELPMTDWRKLVPALLVAACAAIPSTAQARFCGVAGESPQEIASNVAKTQKFKRIGGTARYMAYSNEAAMVTLTVTTSANKAHPAVACRRAIQKKGDWVVSTEIRCAASKTACGAMLSEFRVLDQQMKQAIEKSKPK